MHFIKFFYSVLIIFCIIDSIWLCDIEINVKPIKKVIRKAKDKVLKKVNTDPKKELVPKDNLSIYPAIVGVFGTGEVAKAKAKHVEIFDNKDLLERKNIYVLDSIPGWEGIEIPIHYPNIFSELRISSPITEDNMKVLPAVAIDRFILFAIEESLLPNQFYLRVAFCMFDSLYPYLEGIPSSETMQDILGASLLSIKKINSTLAVDVRYCRENIANIADSLLNLHGNQACDDMLLCMYQGTYPMLSKSMRHYDFDELILRSYMNKGLNIWYHNDSVKPAEVILWNILKFLHKSSKWKYYSNPNKLFIPIRAFILSLYILHSGTLYAGWPNNLIIHPSLAIKSLVVYKKKDLELSKYRIHCINVVRRWLKNVTPKKYVLIAPNLSIIDSISNATCHQAIKTGFVSNHRFDFTNMIEEGFTHVDLLNLQIPIVQIKGGKKLEYMRKYNIGRKPEARRWSHYHKTGKIYDPINYENYKKDDIILNLQDELLLKNYNKEKQFKEINQPYLSVLELLETKKNYSKKTNDKQSLGIKNRSLGNHKKIIPSEISNYDISDTESEIESDIPSETELSIEE
ncbi:hypothetical protein cand_004630 [Cryptosporidium andersoni]|uniref:Uncharacterized protein n=1 Tax=Cryptosporidium andersoni TaxID=117008 RepID=A0A1J4MLP8_9CRYT|nr:hypothetical protein cand_004630 [Cryptosporidium andersoni]